MGKCESARIDKLSFRQIVRKPRVHLSRAGHALVPIGNERLHIRGGGTAVRLPQAVDLVALGLGFPNRGRLLLFPAILVCRHRFHIGDVERHQVRADGCVELGVLL